MSSVAQGALVSTLAITAVGVSLIAVLALFGLEGMLLHQTAHMHRIFTIPIKYLSYPTAASAAIAMLSGMIWLQANGHGFRLVFENRKPKIPSLAHPLYERL